MKPGFFDGNLEEGDLARVGRVRASILSTLGVDAISYKLSLQPEFSDEDSESIRAKKAKEAREIHNAEFGKYAELCTYMSRYRQWSSNLQLEAPTSDLFEDLQHSSLLSTMGPPNLDAETGGARLNIPKYLADAMKKTAELADHRRNYLTGLLELLPRNDSWGFNPLLEVWIPPGSTIPDVKAVNTLYVLQDCWRKLAEEEDSKLATLPLEEKYPAAIKAYARTTRFFCRTLELEPGVEKHSGSDPLPARLLLATSLNRALWELLEFERFEKTAISSLAQLLKELHFLGEKHVPATMTRKEFSKWLLRYFGGDCLLIPRPEWRPLKAQHIHRFYKRAEWVIELESEMSSDGQHLTPARVKSNLCVLAMVWSYCTREKHDLRVPLVKDNDLVGGREDVGPHSISPTTRLYHRRQISLLYESMQYIAIYSDVAELYSKVNIAKRRELACFLESVFRGASLSKWETIAQLMGEPSKMLVPMFTAYPFYLTSVLADDY